MRRLALIAGLTLAAASARAADRGDVYLEGTVGMRFQETRESKPQAGATLGYVVVDSLGFGFGFDRTFSIEKHDEGVDVFQYYAEGRWFLEPWEFSSALGWQELEVVEENRTKTGVVVLATANYLMALTPNLASKVEFRGQYVANERSYVFAGVGMRYLF